MCGNVEHREDNAAPTGYQLPPASPKARAPYYQDLQDSISRENAKRLGAEGRKILHDAVLAELAKGPANADCIAARIGASYASIRARVSELADHGLLCRTSSMARGAGGGPQAIVRLATPGEMSGLKQARKAARLEREKRKFAKTLIELGVSI
jgi:predicted transcriptional regulator